LRYGGQYFYLGPVHLSFPIKLDRVGLIKLGTTYPNQVWSGRPRPGWVRVAYVISLMVGQLDQFPQTNNKSDGARYSYVLPFNSLINSLCTSKPKLESQVFVFVFFPRFLFNG
jgi:hypothetical protein